MDVAEHPRRFWSDNAFLGVATLIAGIFNTVYSILLAHALGPIDYGRVVALNNMVSLLLLPLPVVGLMAIRLGKQPNMKWVEWAALSLGGLMFLIAILLSGIGARTFHVHRDLIVLFSVTVLFNFGYALYIGFIERARRYDLVGLLLVLSSGLSVVAVALTVTLGRQHPLFWLGVTQCLAFVVVFVTAQRKSHRTPSLTQSVLGRRVLATTLGVGSLQAFWGLTDSLWAKAHLSQVHAGLYTGLATIGQSLPFLVSSLAVVMLTAILDDPQNRRRYLGRTMLITLGLIALFIAVLSSYPETVVRLALGAAFVPMVFLIERYSEAMSALALVMVLTTYGVAVGALRAMVAAVLGTLFWMVWLASAYTMSALVQRTLIAMVLTLGLIVLSFLWPQNKPTR